MKNNNLSVYLEDHLAGSVLALELVDHLIESKVDATLEIFLKSLRTEIQTDQDTLQNLIDALGVPESKLKSATAWVMEKAARIKLHTFQKNDLGILQSLEGLALGIMGKKGLWCALPLISGEIPQLEKIDFGGLEKRAQEQFDKVEARRLEAAQRILSQ